MGKLKLAVAGETLFAARLAECIKKNAPEYLEVSSCRQFHNLSEFLNQLQPDMIIYEPNDSIQELLPQNAVKILLSCEKTPKEDSPLSIFRYQQGPEILRQAFQIYEKTATQNLVYLYNTKNLEITAFFAPGGHEYQLPFSISYAALCGETVKVLYLNLAEFTGMVPLLQDTEGENFSDLIYWIRQKKERFLLCLQGVLHQTDHFDYLQPPANPQDLYDMTEADLTGLLSLLQEQTEYQQIVFNCGTWNRAVEQILVHCSKIYCMVKESSLGKYRKMDFEQFLDKGHRKNLKNKIHYIYPSTANGGFAPGIDLLSQLQRGDFAEQVRRLTINPADTDLPPENK
ncbi:MAG: hypothetical protein HFH30_07675 [Eubacterium sp.]|nr:hypothetical protein [Eubacterium sp.]MCI8918551.1 hypothetical protein [Eubacterium sp.]